MNKISKRIITKLLKQSGITINGQQPWDIQIQSEHCFKGIWMNPELTLGENYVKGLWDCQQLDEFFHRLLRFNLNNFQENESLFAFHVVSRLKLLHSYLINFQTKKRAFIVGKKHYDIGNELYQLMLDKRMNYSCGYWKNAATLDEAQEAKLELVCQKLQLKPGMKVLDIGCGWGSFSRYAAEKYGVTVTGVTISQEQQRYANKSCEGLPVKILLQDYRELNESFDRICSIGMFEHVGLKNYHSYMKVASRCLKKDGLFLLHTIGNNYTLGLANPWIRKYIFPNGAIPSIRQIGKAIEQYFVMEDWHNFGVDYDKTLLAWHAKFNQHWDSLSPKYDESFRRMWNYYLLSCAGAFRARDIQLWQIVLSKSGIEGGYQSIR